MVFWFFAFFDLGAEVGGVDEDDLAVVVVVEEEDGDVGAGGGEDVAGHGDDAAEHVVCDEVLADLLFDAALGGDEAGGHDDGGFSAFGEGVDDVLEEEQVDRHFVLGLGGHFGDAGEEAVLVFLGVELVAVVGKIEFEGWVGDDVVELPEGFAFLVVGIADGVALDDVGDGVDQAVEDEIEAEEAGGFLGDVFGVEGAFLLADGVGEVHEQGAGAGGGVVAGDVVALLGDEAGGHDLGDGVRGVILGVFAAAVFVVVLDEVFEEGGVEVELFGEDALEAEGDEFVDDGLGERIAA